MRTSTPQTGETPTSCSCAKASISRVLTSRLGMTFTALNSLLTPSLSLHTIPKAPDPSSFSRVHFVLTSTLRFLDRRSDVCVMCSMKSSWKFVRNLYRASVVNIGESMVVEIADLSPSPKLDVGTPAFRRIRVMPSATRQDLAFTKPTMKSRIKSRTHFGTQCI